MKNNQSRIGETTVNTLGEVMFIIAYNGCMDVTVQFKATDEIVKNVHYTNFKDGRVKSHFTPSVFGQGIVGLEHTRDSEGNFIPSYRSWVRLMERVFSKEFHIANPTYVGCTVSKEWLTYRNFRLWYEANYYEVDGETSQLDKDCLILGNREYSAETCIFTPRKINMLFKTKPCKGSSMAGKRFCASVYKGSNKKNYYFKTEPEAISTYRKGRLAHIKEIAESYYGRIPSKLYNAMITYTF